ncbi:MULTISPECIES: acyl carrier protein [Amycolatopsis]|uniref:Methoxymalonate biosynthesis protein n=1 Tax=Amycolatopsis orientalis TaxID=31958 RepID=A0A193BV90_AMYOR|nr:acyl carrier protein [Amycolatopsis orientalis]ANN16095.1 methoxymalonate biosynthesis protein [Amycolatopsis orientalis]
MTVSTVEQDLLSYLESRTKSSWEPDRDLFTAGGLSSLFAMELVVHIEQVFDVVIAGADLRLDNFRTVHAMTALVNRLRENHAG